MNKKHAFSLIEVLLVMGILTVVITMGFSISKKGMEKAYNQYWYTGYQALWDSSNDAFYRGISNNNTVALQNYAEHIGQTLMKCKTVGWNGTTATFTASNGISFEITQEKTIVPPQTNPRYFVIDMTIPKPVTKSNSTPNKAKFIYYFNAEAPIIYPANYTATGYINLHKRVDILPFYIRKPGESNTKNFYDFQTAYCKVYNSLSAASDNFAKITCGPTPDTPEGTILPINPRKIY